MRDQQQQRARKASAFSAYSVVGCGPLRARVLLAAVLVTLSGCDTVSSAIDSVTPSWVGDETPYAGNVSPTTAAEHVAQQPPTLPQAQAIASQTPASPQIVAPAPAAMTSRVVPTMPAEAPTALGTVPAYVPDSLRYRDTATTEVSPAPTLARAANVRAALGMDAEGPTPEQQAEPTIAVVPAITPPPAAVAAAMPAPPPMQPTSPASVEDLGNRVVRTTTNTAVAAPVAVRPPAAIAASTNAAPVAAPQIATLDDVRGRVITATTTAPTIAANDPLAGRIVTAAGRPVVPANLADVPARPADLPSAAVQQQRIVAMQAEQTRLQQQQQPTAPQIITPAQMPAVTAAPLQPVVVQAPITATQAPVQLAPQPVQVAQVSNLVPNGVNNAFQRALQQSAPNRFQPVPPMQQPLTPSAVPQSAATQPRVLQSPTPQAAAPMARPIAPALVGSVHFEADSARLRPAELIPLGQLAQRLRQQGTKVRVIGYAPRTGRGDATDLMLKSFQLSIDRADAVARKLMELGVPAAQIAVEGKGADAGATAQSDSAHANRVDLLPGS